MMETTTTKTLQEKLEKGFDKGLYVVVHINPNGYPCVMSVGNMPAENVFRSKGLARWAAHSAREELEEAFPKDEWVENIGVLKVYKLQPSY